MKVSNKTDVISFILLTNILKRTWNATVFIRLSSVLTLAYNTTFNEVVQRFR